MTLRDNRKSAPLPLGPRDSPSYLSRLCPLSRNAQAAAFNLVFAEVSCSLLALFQWVWNTFGPAWGLWRLGERWEWGHPSWVCGWEVDELLISASSLFVFHPALKRHFSQVQDLDRGDLGNT